MQKYAGTIITWLICQQAIQERDRELYTYAPYNILQLETIDRYGNHGRKSDNL